MTPTPHLPAENADVRVKVCTAVTPGQSRRDIPELVAAIRRPIAPIRYFNGWETQRRDALEALTELAERAEQAHTEDWNWRMAVERAEAAEQRVERLDDAVRDALDFLPAPGGPRNEPKKAAQILAAALTKETAHS